MIKTWQFAFKPCNLIDMKIISLFSLILCFCYSANSKGALPPKVKVLLVTSTYGTVAGALLGTASLAFKAKGRAVAQGASLGLYAGIIFGTYVVVSHGQKNSPTYQQAPAGGDQIYPEDSPYSTDYYGTGIFDHHKDLTLSQKKGHDVPFFINIANISF